ncbi:MAG: hypothetical protein ABNH03_14695 [Alteromonas sp.]|jgi:hypothetical protein|uniref:hypothetical protein n=1 Tax=Alteromonas sp. TaxID=232 RepID=UPI00269C0878|tara:strand:+ start:3186 stop:3590 length:405 start_codon:yes stop_codon:yes gene_type:complete
MNTRNLQLVFETLVKEPNQPNASENLKLLALAVWYQDFVPSVDSFNGQEVGLAGYVLDKLTRYNCLSSEKKSYLRTHLLSELERKKAALFLGETNSKDMLAKQWGTPVDLKKEFRSLLPYQKRHFQHSNGPLAA